MLTRIKYYLTILLLLTMVNLQSQEVIKDNWLSIGYESSNVIETINFYGDAEVSTMKTLGVNLTGYRFDKGKNIGSFVSDSMLFADQDVFAHLGIAFGPAYRKEVLDNLYLKGGLGLSIFMFLMDEARYSSFFWNFGLAGDFGVKYDINEFFYLDIGTKVGYDMLNISLLDTDEEPEFSYTTDYQMIRYAPYIGFGINFYNRNGKLTLH